MAPPVDLHSDSETSLASSPSMGSDSEFAMPMGTSTARDVGICAMEMYFPSQFVSQAELGTQSDPFL